MDGEKRITAKDVAHLREKVDRIDAKIDQLLDRQARGRNASRAEYAAIRKTIEVEVQALTVQTVRYGVRRALTLKLGFVILARVFQPLVLVTALLGAVYVITQGWPF